MGVSGRFFGYAIGLLLLAVGVTLGLIVLPRLVYPPLTNEQLQGVGEALMRLQLKSARSALEVEFRWQLIALVGMFLGAGMIGSWMWSKK
ncbi:hypothetical protein Psi01_17900 [Planobispora siamensis]|uniref:Uncharacterized protein n=1 Tax=Planobispora siamensis TaxID=936338 RepID=A0A8J3WJ58_9ACTN|nr:hypothetical protein Psi01_17900 [Planobispora siamensis]